MKRFSQIVNSLPHFQYFRVPILRAAQPLLRGVDTYYSEDSCWNFHHLVSDSNIINLRTIIPEESLTTLEILLLIITNYQHYFESENRRSLSAEDGNIEAELFFHLGSCLATLKPSESVSSVNVLPFQAAEAK